MGADYKIRKVNIKRRLYLSGIDTLAYSLAKAGGFGYEVTDFCWAPQLENQTVLEKARRECAALNRRTSRTIGDATVGSPAQMDASSFVPDDSGSSSALWFHAPFAELIPCAIDPLVREIAKKRYLQSVALAQSLGINRIVIHGGFIPTVYFPEWYIAESVKFWKEFLLELDASVVEPAVFQMNRVFPIEGGSAPSSGRENNLPVFAGRENNLPVSAGDEDNPTVSTGDEDNPTVSAGDEDNPTVSTGDEDNPTVSTGDEDNPTVSARKKSIQIALENVMEPEPGMLVDIVRGVGDPRLGLCLDVGHANSNVSSIPVMDWVEAFAPYMFHVHLHNNLGDHDLHSPLGEGTIPMEVVLDRLLKTDATFTIENQNCKPSIDWLREKGYL